MSQELRWPKERFYWAVLEAPGVRVTHRVPEGLHLALQEELPVPVESVHMVAAPMEGGRLAVCAAPRDALQEELPEVLRLTPDGVPSFIGSKLAPDVFNLLTEEFEPAPSRKERNRRQRIIATAGVSLACLLALGFARRQHAWNIASEDARAAAATLAATTANSGGLAGVKLELDHLRQAPRPDSKSLSSPDAAAALASLLLVWPRELECQTESVNVSATTMTLSLIVATDARPFLSALKAPDGWTLEEPRLSSSGDGSHLQLILHRKEARS